MLEGDVENIMRIFRDHVIRVSERDVKIVGRDREARTVVGGVSGIDRALSHHITVLYGTKRCGRTTFFNSLFDSLVESIHMANSDKKDGTLFEAIMIS